MSSSQHKVLSHDKKWEISMDHIKKKREPVEFVPDEAQMLNLLSMHFKSTIINNVKNCKGNHV